MKTPYYSGDFTAAQHTNDGYADELRERMLEHRLAARDDVREIHVVTALPSFRTRGTSMAKKISEKQDLTPLMHWAIQVGDQYFELQKGYSDPLRTGLRMSSWDVEQRGHIIERHRQGTTAMSDDEIKNAGEKYFSRLERIDVNVYNVWCNNCQLAVDCMLRDIGGLSYYRKRFKSIREMVRQFFYNRVIDVTKLYGRYRGWNEDLITKYSEVLHKTLRVMTERQTYPKRHWIREDIDAAEGSLKKVGTVADHWLLTVLESSLSLKQGSAELYVRRDADGKTELNFDNLKKATKGIFDQGDDSRLSWLKAMPWLTAGFLVGTPKWAAAVIHIALSRAKELYEDHQGRKGDHQGLKGGMEASLLGLGVSPKVQNDIWFATSRPNMRGKRQATGQRRVRSKILPLDDKLVARYERCFSSTGVLYFFDQVNKTRSWDAPDQQEMCHKITDPPLSKRWDIRQGEDRIFYFNRVTEEVRETRPGPPEIWVVKKKIKPDWVKSTTMALPHGWEMRRTEEGEQYYLNHTNDPPTSTTIHPMRQEIEDERKTLLPEWNVEWDTERGKKYRKILTGEIRWKAIDGPRHMPSSSNTQPTRKGSHDGFTEPLPQGWTLITRHDDQRVYWNGKVGKERMERTTHPLSDKRRRLQPDWEMRYTPGSTRYWVHYGNDGRGSTWWTRHRLLKNTSLQNNASGWKLAKNGQGWEWFEGGDVPHSEIPVLDLDDPADREFREHPFVLPPRLTDDQGHLVEPLPSDWVRRQQGDGSTYYWNFKTESRSEEHPNEEERSSLHALWSMRFTRHGRLYFHHHEDGSSWWTHPREDKHKQILRAHPGQNQDGWKIGEDIKTWERFEDHPDAESTEDILNALTPTQPTESETSRPERSPSRSSSDPRKWLQSINSSDNNPREWLLRNVNSSDSNPREWLKSVNSNERVISAKANFATKRPGLLKKFSKSPSITSNASPNSTFAESPQPMPEGEDGHEAPSQWLGDASEIIAEPELTEDSDCFAKRDSLEGPKDCEEPEQILGQQEEMNRKTPAPKSLEVIPVDYQTEESTTQETPIALIEPQASKEESYPSTTPRTPWSPESDITDTPLTQPDESTTPASTPPTPMPETPKTLYSRAKDTRKGLTKRGVSHLSAIKEKHKSRFGSKDASTVSADKADSQYVLEPATDGLGITGAGGSMDSGGQAEMLTPITEQADMGEAATNAKENAYNSRGN